MSPSWLRWGSWSDHLHASSPCSPLPQPLRAPGGSASSLTHPGPERAGTRLPSGQDPGRRAGGEEEARRRASVGGHRPAPPSSRSAQTFKKQWLQLLESAEKVRPQRCH